MQTKLSVLVLMCMVSGCGAFASTGSEMQDAGVVPHPAEPVPGTDQASTEPEIGTVLPHLPVHVSDASSDIDSTTYVPQRKLTFMWGGNPAGLMCVMRTCEGSPVGYNDMRDDANVEWRRWPDQPASVTGTWRDFGGDVLNDSTMYSQTVSYSATDSLRFQCLDMQRDSSGVAHIKYACSPGGPIPMVLEGTIQRVVTIVSNGKGGYNCQVN